jgi:hypothetical protein
MELFFSKSNTIKTSYAGITGPIGSIQEKRYTVDLGTFLYNETFLSLNNLVIPLKDQIFFDLPQDKNKYAVINIYYDATGGYFIFDKIGVYDKYVEKITATALFNVIPIAQFVIRESLGGFEVINFSEYSQMSTFTITDVFTQGETGLKADIGCTGARGVTGLDGAMGYTGPIGDTGSYGLTGMSFPGITGPMGETGAYVDENLLLYYKFNSSDIKLIDFSPYERDSVFTYTGILDDYDNPLSYFSKELGIVDSCHNVIYEGGFSSYKRNEFFEFGGETGTISAWIKLTEKPIADFTYTVTGLYFTPVNISERHPTSWIWWIDYDPSYEGEDLGNVFTVKNPKYIFSDYGTYIVKLRAINANGYNEISKFVEI